MVKTLSNLLKEINLCKSKIFRGNKRVITKTEFLEYVDAPKHFWAIEHNKFEHYSETVRRISYKVEEETR